MKRGNSSIVSRSLATVLGGLALIGTLAASSAAEAGIVFTSRDSRTFATGQVGSMPIDLSEGTDQTGTFDLGFDQEIDANDASGATAHARFTQHSTLGTLPPGIFHAAGQFDAFTSLSGAGTDDVPPGPSKVSGASIMTVFFSVIDRAEPFHVTASFTNDLPDVDSARVALARTDGESIFHVSNGGESANDAERTGQLEPGDYRLDVEAASGVSRDGGSHANSVDFDFQAGGAAVPLPAAVWPAGALLIGIAGRRLFPRKA